MSDSCLEFHKKLLGLLGPERYKSDLSSKDYYSTCTISERITNSGIVFPETTEEVSQILRLANEYLIPVYPFSTGKNWGYGTTMPNQPKGLVLIMERMNRIHEVNSELAYAIIEPGVTQFQLNHHLKSNNIPLWMDCTDSTPYASVMGNALERGVGYTPYGDHFGQLCGLEVVLPDGSIHTLDTLKNKQSETFYTYKWGIGPFLDGIFSQSNLGIVTKVGIWLMPAPEDYRCFFLELNDIKDFELMIDNVRKLALERIIGNVHIFNPVMTLMGYEAYPHDIDEISTYFKKSFKDWDIHPWAVIGGVYGTTAQVTALENIVRKHMSSFCQINFMSQKQLNLVNKIIPFSKSALGYFICNTLSKIFLRKPFKCIAILPKLLTYQRGETGEFIISRAFYKNKKQKPTEGLDPAHQNCGLYWLAPIVPCTGNSLSSFIELLEIEHKNLNSDLCLSLIQVNPRTMIAAIFIVYDKDDPKDTARATLLYHTLAQKSQEAGYQQYRTSVLLMDSIIGKDTGAGIIGNAIKRALDPNNILAPGRYGLGISEK